MLELLLTLVLAGVPAPPDPGASSRPAGGARRQTPAAPSASAEEPARASGAYYQFILGRSLESQDDIAGAIAAHQRAARLDPGSAEIPAELAALYARQNRVRDAIATAEAALKIDSTNAEAHRVLGMAYAASATRAEARRPTTKTAGDFAPRAIEHLEQSAPGGLSQTDTTILYTLGRLYVQTAAFDKAVPLLERLIELDGSPDSLVLLAQALNGAGRAGEAAEVLARAARYYPQLHATLAQYFERERRWREAADSYARAAELGTLEAPGRIRWATSLLNLPGRASAARARDVLADLVKSQPGNGRALYLLSQAHRRLDALDDAESAARLLIELDPNGVWGHYALAQVYERRREYRRVIDTLGPIVARSPDRSGAVQQPETSLLAALMGFAYEELGDFTRAIDSFEMARKASASDAAYEVYLVQAYVSAKRYAEAVAQAHRARAQFPAELRLAQLEAEALRSSGQADRGVAVMEEAARTNGAEPRAYTGLAQTYASASRFDDAVRVLREAVHKFPDDLSIPFQLGAVFERQKRDEEAERAFRQVIDRDPEHAQALNYLGYMLADRGVRLEESVGYIERALKIDPQNASYRDSLGWAYFKLNRLDLAEEHLRRAGEQLHRNSVVQDHLGDLLFTRGRHREAIAAWERALAGDGESIEKSEIERKIRQAQDKIRNR